MGVGGDAAGDGAVPGTTQTDQLNAQLLKAYKGALDAGAGAGLALAGRGAQPEQDDAQSNSSGGWGDGASGGESDGGGIGEESAEAQSTAPEATAAAVSEMIACNASSGAGGEEDEEMSSAARASMEPLLDGAIGALKALLGCAKACPIRHPFPRVPGFRSAGDEVGVGVGQGLESRADWVGLPAGVRG